MAVPKKWKDRVALKRLPNLKKASAAKVNVALKAKPFLALVFYINEPETLLCSGSNKSIFKVTRPGHFENRLNLIKQ